MIAQRITVQHKPGTVNEGIALVKAELARINFPHAARIYTPHSNNNISIGEYEFETIAEMELFWADWEAQPETAIFHAQYGPLIEPDMGNEIFDLY